MSHILIRSIGLWTKSWSRRQILRSQPTASVQSRSSASKASPGSDSKPADDEEAPGSDSKELSRQVTVEEDIPDEEFVITTLDTSRLVPEVPIVSLGIDRRIEKVKKSGSFAVDMFAGSFDDDFLTYPDPLKNRKENQLLKNQAVMVRQLWPQIWDDDLQLQKFNFFNLFQISVTEMMIIFEAIGASSTKCYEDMLPATLSELTPAQHHTVVAKSILSIIIRNCLTYRPIYESDNYKAKELLPQKDVLFGGASEDKNVYQPISFCWTEHGPNLGSLAPQEWQSFGTYGGSDLKHYLIKGKKTRVLYDSRIEKYLVFFRDGVLSEKYKEKLPDDEPNIATDPFIASCLLEKSEVNFGVPYFDSAGFEYNDIEFDVAVPDDRVIFHAERKSARALNIKALGQLAACSVTLGILKDTVRRTYKYLLKNKSGLLTCDIIERKLSYVTCKIFALESMVYYIAGMYDGLEAGFDAHMEATILKIVTSEYAYDVLRDLQLVSGSEMYNVSRLQDQVNIYDSFLDGNVYNRLYLSTMGVIWFARSNNLHLNQLKLAPWYPGYFLKHMIKERTERRGLLTLNADIYGNLHPLLKEAAVNLEYIVKRVKYATETICLNHGTDVTSAQTALYKLAQLSIDSFVLTTVCARASKSFCNGSRNSELDIAIAIHISRELARKVKFYIEDLQTLQFSLFDNKVADINNSNLKLGGYYAESPLDPNI